MSTLNSTNMSITRPTTKVRHAPGGASSFSLSYDDTPVNGTASKSKFKATFEPSPELAPTAKVEEAPKELEVETPAVAAVPPPAPSVAENVKTTITEVAAGTTIGLVYASGSVINEVLKNRTLEALQSRGITDISVLPVNDILQLPFGAKQLLAKGTCQSVVVVAALTEEAVFAKEVAAAVINGVVQLSLEQSVPVVPGFVFAATEKEATSKAIDAPATFVTSALSLLKLDLEPVAASTTTAAPAAPVPEPVKEVEPVKTTEKEPEKAVVSRPPSSPMVSHRGRGAGPSSIVFG